MNEPELSGRLKGALRFQGPEDKAELMPFLAEGWDREGAVILWDISKIEIRFLLVALLSLMFFCHLWPSVVSSPMINLFGQLKLLQSLPIQLLVLSWCHLCDGNQQKQKKTFLPLSPSSCQPAAVPSTDTAALVQRVRASTPTQFLLNLSSRVKIRAGGVPRE